MVAGLRRWRALQQDDAEWLWALEYLTWVIWSPHQKSQSEPPAFPGGRDEET